LKTRVLIRTQAFEESWIGVAFGGKEGVLAALISPTQLALRVDLTRSVEYTLATAGRDYLRNLGHAGSQEAVVCPEGAIRRPIDTWICKVDKKTCPIQAQVRLDDPQHFFGGCLLAEDRRNAIFATVQSGRYRGFHHMTGRYLCPRCEELQGNESAASYHYPWELSSFTRVTEFDLDRDMLTAVPLLSRANMGRSVVLAALCARHCIEVAELLTPHAVGDLDVLQLDIHRPDQ
jgi:hypothetical protein